MSDEKWGVFNENGLIQSFSSKEDAEKLEDKYNLMFQTCGFYTKKISN
jgi:hypothetical protein